MAMPNYSASPQAGVRSSGLPNRYTNVSEAAQQQSLNDVLDLLARGHNVDEKDTDGNTALHWAAWFKLDSLLPRLLDRRARPDITNSSGETPVHWAAKSSNIHALDTLTRGDRTLLGARDCDGFTPFIISAQNDNAPVMEWMYLKGCSIEEQDNWGRTALQWACYKGHRRSVQWLLSRGASITHRDHEGTTALHWAALKGHCSVADMLLEVGGVHFVDVPDSAGDTPMILAVRKKNRYLVVCFLKCQVLQAIIGRPYVSRNHFANFFMLFIAINVLVFSFIVAPGIANLHPSFVIKWAAMMSATLVLWVQNCFADPGWIRPKTINSQEYIIGKDPMTGFDAEQPVESQMAHYDSLAGLLAAASGDGHLSHLELEQNKLNYQRQLITQAQKRLSESAHSARVAGAYGMAAGTGETELQPLMDSQTGVQLDRASLVLREREGAAGEEVGRARVERLLSEGGGEYMTLLDKGDFKQVCVVCRARKRMRSHHCKECGRCVDRLDHHCPWIDNCVGLGNQRSFYCFIVMLFATIVSWYYGAFLYLCDVVYPMMAHGSFLGFVHSLAHGSVGPEVSTLLVIALSLFNLVWLAFVGALVARHTAYMAMNITTYEVLVRPSHVQRRFPRAKGRFWFLQGFTIVDAVGRIWSYWTLDTDRDAADFLGTPGAKDSFVVPDLERGCGSGSGGGTGVGGVGVGSGGPTFGTPNRGEHKSGGSAAAYHLVSPIADSPA